MKVDYHLHSTRSDGTISPAQLLTLASERGLAQLAITDHDTMAAYADLMDLEVSAQGLGPRLITGCEFSSLWNGRNIHIVGLNMDLANPELLGALKHQKALRARRAQGILEVLVRRGYRIPMEDVERLAAGGMVGRPHFARVLVNTGQVRTVAQAFKKLLGTGRDGDIKVEWPDAAVVTQWIRAAGGVAVVAHPLKYGMTLTKLRQLLEDFKAMGGDGMEVISGAQDPAKTRTLTELCLRYRLLASTGSDFHSPGQPWANLGMQPSLPEVCTPVWEAWMPKPG